MSNNIAPPIILDSETIRKILEMYREHRLLWDSNHPDYNIKSRRELSWCEIAAAVDISVKDLKRKMTSLLGSYRREKARIRKGRVTSTGEEYEYKSNWFAFPWFKFLSERDNPEQDSYNEDFVAINDLTQYGFEETIVIEESTNEELKNSDRKPTTTRPTSTVAPVSQSAKRKRRLNNSPPVNKAPQNNMATPQLATVVLEAYSTLKKQSATRDHYETFGNHVTSELRKYDNKTLPHVKRAILDILFRADIGEFTPEENLLHGCNE